MALVCSTACGADLVALEEAERLGRRRRIVFAAAAKAAGDLVVLPPVSGSDEAAYATANETIVREALALARGGAPHRLIAARRTS